MRDDERWLYTLQNYLKFPYPNDSNTLLTKIPPPLHFPCLFVRKRNDESTHKLTHI